MSAIQPSIFKSIFKPPNHEHKSPELEAERPEPKPETSTSTTASFTPRETPKTAQQQEISRTVYSHVARFHLLIQGWKKNRGKSYKVGIAIYHLNLPQYEEEYFPRELQPLMESLMEILGDMGDIFEGAPCVASHRCHCSNAVDSCGNCGLSCYRSTGRIARHCIIYYIIHQALASASVPAVLEPNEVTELENRLQALAKLHPNDDPVLTTWSVKMVAEKMNELCKLLKKEYQLLETIIENVAHDRDEDNRAVYGASLVPTPILATESAFLFAEAGLPFI